MISVDELANLLDSVRLCDVRWDLTDPAKGRLAYRTAHLPGAVFVDLDTDLAGPPGSSGRHPLPDLDAFAETLGRLGISDDTHVVAYDDVAGRYAARLWWMLRSIGHETVQVLDGGIDLWVRAGRPLEAGWVQPDPVTYTDIDAFTGVARHHDLEGRHLIDARAGERYRGETEPVDPKAGHIPGAVNISTSRNLAPDGRFLDPERLREVYEGSTQETVMSCGSGVTACHNALAMVAAGLPMPAVYIGSFSEWARLDLPVVTGDRP